jgi:hypothetical protein
LTLNDVIERIIMPIEIIIDQCTVPNKDLTELKNLVNTITRLFPKDSLSIIITKDAKLEIKKDELLGVKSDRFHSGAMAFLYKKQGQYNSAILLPLSKIIDISSNEKSLNKFSLTFYEECFHIINYYNFLHQHGFHAYEIQNNDPCTTYLMNKTFKLIDEYLAMSKLKYLISGRLSYPNLTTTVEKEIEFVLELIENIRKSQEYPIDNDIPAIIFSKILERLVRNEEISSNNKPLENAIRPLVPNWVEIKNILNAINDHPDQIFSLWKKNDWTDFQALYDTRNYL